MLRVALIYVTGVEFAFYVNKSGWRSKKDVTIYWEGSPTAFGECSGLP